MFYCPACGTGVEEVTSFCGSCGGQLQARPTASLGPSVAGPPDQAQFPPRQGARSANRKPIGHPGVLVGGIALVLVIILGAIHLAGSGASSGSPQSVASAVATDLHVGELSQLCLLVVPNDVSKCQSDMAQAAAAKVTYSALAVGAVTVQGDRALAVWTGTICSNGSCNSNHDPNAAIGKGLTFDQVYSAVVNGNSQEYPFLALVKQNGKWYVNSSN